jgi:hypothetical protein
MKRITYAAVPLALCLLGATALAGNRSGIVTAQFLKLPVSARAVAMGNAQVAMAEGAISMAYNPAGILTTQQFAFGATYNQWYADISHSFFGLAANFQEWGTVGVGVTTLATDNMAVTTPAFPEGTGEFFKAAEYAVTVSYGRQISEDFSLGLSFKWINSNLYNDEINADAIAFDIGSLYDVPVLRTRLGISVTNLGRDLRYLNEQYSLPTALRFGARTNVYQTDYHRVYAVAQVGRPNDSDEQYNIGVEYTYQALFSLRSGYRFNYDTENWSAGVGVMLASLGIDGTIDYAYTNYQFLPGTHMFSLELGF